jgi:hypothetical protein
MAYAEALWLAAQVTYEHNTQGVHGMDVAIASTTTPIATATVDLDISVYTEEYFTSISGTILTAPGPPVLARGVAPLTFRTNKRVVGPFGIVTADRPFEFLGPVSAFHGTVNRTSTVEVLTAIGFWKVAAPRPVSTGAGGVFKVNQALSDQWEDCSGLGCYKGR